MDELGPKQTGCGWEYSSHLMKRYHDEEWGVPVHDDYVLYEFLVLEGFQAGLSWNTILNKRENFREAFDGFDFEKVAEYGEEDMERLLSNKGIVRNKRKILAAINNSKKVLEIREEFGSFDHYIWGLVGDRPIVNEFTGLNQLPSETETSRSMSRELKDKGFKFVGPTICYAYMQTVGMVNDHLITCHRHREIKEKY
jgi:DNA-3-methyladenine glycosylase I